jgi:DNA-binding NarL/FixJ family response regulator
VIALGVVEESPGGSVEPFFTWFNAMDLNRFNISISHVSPTIERAAAEAKKDRPDVWLLRSRSTSNLQALHELCGSPVPRSLLRQVVAVCDGGTDEIGCALSCCVSAVVLMSDSPWEIVGAIHAAASRKLFVSSQILNQYRQQLVEVISSPATRRLDRLTERELEVLISLADGKSNAAIARELFITRATVGSHVLSILRKLEVANRTEAAVMAHKLGLRDQTRRDTTISTTREVGHDGHFAGGRATALRRPVHAGVPRGPVAERAGGPAARVSRTAHDRGRAGAARRPGARRSGRTHRQCARVGIALAVSRCGRRGSGVACARESGVPRGRAQPVPDAGFVGRLQDRLTPARPHRRSRAGARARSC